MKCIWSAHFKSWLKTEGGTTPPSAPKLPNDSRIFLSRLDRFYTVKTRAINYMYMYNTIIINIGRHNILTSRERLYWLCSEPYFKNSTAKVDYDAGIGRDLALKLAACGGEVYGVSRTAEHLQSLKVDY